MITLREMVMKAITEKNHLLAGKITEFLWIKKSMNYKEIYKFVNKIEPIPMPEWDELLCEYDTEK